MADLSLEYDTDNDTSDADNDNNNDTDKDTNDTDEIVKDVANVADTDGTNGTDTDVTDVINEGVTYDNLTIRMLIIIKQSKHLRISEISNILEVSKRTLQKN